MTGVVNVLKVIVSYELERRENDARMGVVLLAKVDLVRVLLEYVHHSTSSVVVNSQEW